MCNDKLKYFDTSNKKVDALQPYTPYHAQHLSWGEDLVSLIEGMV